LEKVNFHDNKTLIDHLAKGDEMAFMFLLDNYHRRLHAYALTLVDDYAMAQDIVQNVFLRTWQFRKKLSDKFSIQSFLYRAVYNEFVNSHQKNRAMLLLQQKYLESLNEVVEDVDDSILERMINAVNKEIKKLPPKCKEVFILSKREGLTNNEISEHLDISVKTVEAQITKAFSRLREKLGGQWETFLFLIFGFDKKIRA